MKTLWKIQIILTVLFVVAIVADIGVVLWLRSMAYVDPVRREWEPRLSLICDIIWSGTLVPWLLFTGFHMLFLILRKLEAWSYHEH
jgi:hypothetical protein